MASPGPRGSGLQFKRKVSLQRSDSVEWEQVAAELARIDPQFSDPRFNSLEHVLRILTSVNSEEELEQLRQQRDSVEALVDVIVERYYAGFNKSLQNYSQILHLFTESRLELDSLRRSLETAHAQLGTQPTALRELYQRDLMLGDVERLLKDVQTVTAVPAKVLGLQDSKEWSLAVATLLSGCNKAAREELAGVGALREVCTDLGQTRTALQTALVAEMESRAYRVHVTSSGASRRGSAQRSLLFGQGSAAGARARLTRPKSYGGDSCQAVASSLAEFPGRAAHRRTLTNSPASSKSFASASPGGGLSEMDGHLLNPETPLSTLVDCVAQLGGVHAALRTVKAHMPWRMRAAIAAALETFPTGQWLPETESGTGGSPSPPTAAVAAAAGGLLEHVYEACLVLFQEVARMLQLLALTKPPRPSAGLEMLLRADADSATGASSVEDASSSSTAAEQPLGPGAARAECALAWECLQLECQALLAAVLDAPPPPRPLPRGSAGSDFPGSVWLAPDADAPQTGAPADDSGQEGSATARDDGGPLTLSLEEEAGEALVPATSLVPGSTAGSPVIAASGAVDLRPLVVRTLGGHPGGPLLVTSAFAPTNRFSEAAERLLASMQDSPGTPSSSGSRSSSLLQLHVPWKPAASQGDAAAAALPPNRALLRSYLENALRMEFLPTVYVDFRARCSAMLEDGEAFKPRQRLRGPYQPGAAVVPAAVATAGMVDKLLSWAAQVPPFATHLAGVLENVLGRVLDACHAQVAEAAGGSAAGRLAESVQVVQLMAKEPSAELLGGPVAFFVGRNADATDSFVSSVIAAGFNAKDESGSKEVMARLLGERPVQAAALLSTGGDARRLVKLAALSDSADHIADAIRRCAAAASLAATDAAAEAGASPSPRASERWQQQLTGRLRQWSRRPGRDPGVAEVLSHVADRYRALAGLCARILRLDLLLRSIHHLECLPRLGAGEGEASQAEDHVAALGRTLTRVDEELAAYLAPDKRAYVFASLPGAVGQVAVGLLPEFPHIDADCLVKVCRVLSTLQPALSAAGAAAAEGVPSGARCVEKAKHYYSLLAHSGDALVAAVAAKPHRFSGDEYLALLEARVAGRKVSPEHRQRLLQILAEAGTKTSSGKGVAPRH